MSRTANIITAAVLFLLLAAGAMMYFQLPGTRRTAAPVPMPAPGSGAQPASGPAVSTAAVQLPAAPAAETGGTAETGATPSDLIGTLLSVRFNEEPGKAFEDGDWTTDLSENYNHNNDARSFYKSGAADEIRLYSYAVPSLEEYKELIMAGYARICREPNQDAAAALLETGGFSVSAPEEKVSGFGAANWQGVLKIDRGDISGFMYYEPYRGKRCLKTVVSHKDVSKYDHPPQISKNYFSGPELPDRLIEELEAYGIAGLPGTDWAAVKDFAKNPGALSPEKLISAYNSVKIDELEEEKKPAFILLREYLASYLFDSVNAETQALFRKTLQDTPPPALKLLEETGIPYRYDRVNGTYYSPAAFSIRLYEDYPESYWGQYVFVKQMAGAFPGSFFTSRLLSEKVTRKGELFLMRNSTSPFITDVLFLLGKAHETSYSAGLSLNSYSGYLCGNTDCEKLLRNNEEYRLNALKFYREILNRPDREKYEGFLRYTIPRLETKTKTYCRFYLDI